MSKSELLGIIVLIWVAVCWYVLPRLRPIHTGVNRTPYQQQNIAFVKAYLLVAGPILVTIVLTR